MKCNIDLDMQIGFIRHNLKVIRDRRQFWKDRGDKGLCEQFDEIEAYYEAIIKSLDFLKYLSGSQDLKND